MRVYAFMSNSSQTVVTIVPFFTLGYFNPCFCCAVRQQQHHHHEAIKEEDIVDLVRTVLEVGMVESEEAAGQPLCWYWHDSDYLGAAHGSMGENMFRFLPLDVSFGFSMCRGLCT